MPFRSGLIASMDEKRRPKMRTKNPPNVKSYRATPRLIAAQKRSARCSHSVSRSVDTSQLARGADDLLYSRTIRQGYPASGIESTPYEPDPVETGGGRR